jgi:predicted outer membrane repeat protein
MHRYVLSLMCLPFLVLLASATEYVVQPDGMGDFNTIQAAINGTVDGDVILLTDGEFAGDGNRDVYFLSKAVTVRSQSGNAGACIINCEGTDAEFHRAFMFVNGEGPESKVWDITIRNGYGDDGGAVFCLDSSPAFSGVVFVDNTSDQQGGALYCLNSSPYISSCQFNSNIAFDHNGGAISLWDSSPHISSCVFDGNETAARGGGIYATGDSELFVVDCEFANNYAAVHGGAVYMNGLANVGAQPLFGNCMFDSNSCLELGGAIVTIWTSARLEVCTIINNTAGEAGAIWCGGSSAAPELYNCTLANNHGNAVGGIYCNDNSEVTLARCIVANNEPGAAIYLADNSYAYLECADLWGNETDWGAGISDQLGINGNIWLDPEFCGAEMDDYTIASSSPCAPFTAPNDECDLIGAWEVGCGGSSPTATTSWGGLKSLYR